MNEQTLSGSRFVRPIGIILTILIVGGALAFTFS